MEQASVVGEKRERLGGDFFFFSRVSWDARSREFLCDDLDDGSTIFERLVLGGPVACAEVFRSQEAPDS